MESIEAPVKVRYIINTKVANIEEEFVPTYISGIGKDALFENRSKGWFAYFEGSYEAIHVGAEKPELAKGDRVRITIERES